MRLLPDPDKVRIRVYQTNSTHKSMSAFRQGSMILVWDEDFHHVEGPFEEAYLAHTSTSPNLQLIASLDVARRQMELEGYGLTMQMTELAIRLRHAINSHPLISKYFHVATPAEMVPAEFRGFWHRGLRSAALELGRRCSSRGTTMNSRSIRRA